ncbi:MAG: adenylate kinase [Tissierellia bacterium]|nr:adenylate kinase [Tissierellia bacterium]
MKRAIVIGCPGSGKSTFSLALHEVTQIPIYHLDMLNWNADKTTVEKSVFLERLKQVIEKDAWIIDGNYGSTMELRLKACDTVYFLDYSLEVCLDGIESRRGKVRVDMPWVDSEDHIDEEFIMFIKSFNDESRPAVIDLLNKYKDKDIYIFKSREEADRYLSKLNGNSDY